MSVMLHLQMYWTTDCFKVVLKGSSKRRLIKETKKNQKQIANAVERFMNRLKFLKKYTISSTCNNWYSDYTSWDGPARRMGARASIETRYVGMYDKHNRWQCSLNVHSMVLLQNEENIKCTCISDISWPKIMYLLHREEKL